MGGIAPQVFHNHWIFRMFNASPDNVRTFAVFKGKGFEFYWKIIELAPLLYRCHNAPEADFKSTAKMSKFDHYCTTAFVLRKFKFSSLKVNRPSRSPLIFVPVLLLTCRRLSTEGFLLKVFYF